MHARRPTPAPSSSGAERGEMSRADLDGVRAWRDLDEDLFSGQRQHHGEEESGW